MVKLFLLKILIHTVTLVFACESELICPSSLQNCIIKKGKKVVRASTCFQYPSRHIYAYRCDNSLCKVTNLKGVSFEAGQRNICTSSDAPGAQFNQFVRYEMELKTAEDIIKIMKQQGSFNCRQNSIEARIVKRKALSGESKFLAVYDEGFKISKDMGKSDFKMCLLNFYEKMGFAYTVFFNKDGEQFMLHSVDSTKNFKTEVPNCFE